MVACLILYILLIPTHTWAAAIIEQLSNERQMSGVQPMPLDRIPKYVSTLNHFKYALISSSGQTKMHPINYEHGIKNE